MSEYKEEVEDVKELIDDKEDIELVKTIKWKPRGPTTSHCPLRADRL